MCGGVRSDAGLVEQLRCELARERFDLACELALLGGQLQHAAGDRAQREQAAAQLGVASAVWSCCCEALQEPCSCQRPQLAAQRLRGRDQQVAQLAEPGAFGVDRSFACGHQVPATPGVHRPHAVSRAAAGRARCGPRGQRRARRSCRPSGAPAAAGRPRAPAHHGRSGSASDRHRTSRCLRPRTRADRGACSSTSFKRAARSRRCSRRPSPRTRPRR